PCNGYYVDESPKMSYRKRRSPLERRGDSEPKDTCESEGFNGPCGTKPTIFKCNGLTWDCGNEGFKHQTCDGPETGIYMIIKSCCLSNSKKRQTGGTSPATINVNDQKNV
ncbi:4863_t:CDS:2, partial [Scutellospora calospora]